MPEPTKVRLQSDKLQAFFHNTQDQIASQFAKISTIIPRWNDGYQKAANAHVLDAYVSSEFLVYPQYLEKAFSTGDELWLDLYIGEKKKQAYPLDGNFEQARTQINAVIDKEISYLKTTAEMADIGKEMTKLTAALDQVRSVISLKAIMEARILWIADCLYLDIQSFLISSLASETLDLQPDLITTKNPVERYEQVSRCLQNNTYDAIFYCPFSYENSTAYTRMLNHRKAVSNAISARRVALEERALIEPMLDLLTENADCPVYIHNASSVMRQHRGIKESMKDILTRFARMQFTHTINSFLDDRVKKLNAKQSAGHMNILDEFSIVKANGLRNTGVYFHHFGLQHPGKLGMVLKESYLDRLVMIKQFQKKKIVICDLDNTLWHGVIGEGTVEHFEERQSILKTLKENGILLATNSKNNIENVTWEGAVLNEQDFACTRINWQTKVQNIGEIAEEMNLDTNSFIFVDDRADERSMVSSNYPDIVTLDAEDPAIWRRLALWAETLNGNSEMDRTRMYRERQSRKKFVGSKPKHSTASLFKQLDLKCNVTLSDEKDLPRITELLNRTNQFNTTGRRTSLKEIKSFHESPEWAIYSARTSDRFGDMGLVSALVTRTSGEKTEIEAFVLSCRVFGYGVETAILRAVCLANAGQTVGGAIIPTSVNQPCQSVYSDHHFHQEDDRWAYDHTSAPIINKDWLNVE